MFTHPVEPWILTTNLTTDMRYRTNVSPCNHGVPLAESQHDVINPANSRGALDDGVQDRLHVCGRAADDAKHLGSCRLMLQGFAQLCVALLDLFEQPHIFNGDNRLVGESF